MDYPRAVMRFGLIAVFALLVGCTSSVRERPAKPDPLPSFAWPPPAPGMAWRAPDWHFDEEQWEWVWVPGGWFPLEASPEQAAAARAAEAGEP